MGKVRKRTAILQKSERENTKFKLPHSRARSWVVAKLGTRKGGLGETDLREGKNFDLRTTEGERKRIKKVTRD